MKKNLKKVISAVIALALSASTFATVSFAKSFTDVASTASYAEAVDVLSALGIVDGYGDGTFGPDKTIKRSEAAKMIVAMVNKLETANDRMGKTQFADVADDHWASGFINVGVTEKFINGKGEGKFDPDGLVKYQEMVKMIMVCLGYEEYANFYGGYPNGYIAAADEVEVTKGCSMDNEAPATRAIVARLIYNALNTPMVTAQGMVYSATEGKFVPNIQKHDPDTDVNAKYFKSLLSEKFDAYLVEGSVTATPKTLSSLKADEVNFSIAKAKYYNNEDIVDSLSYKNLNNLKVGETKAADYINTYATAIVKADEDEIYTIVSFVPSGKNKTATADLALFDEDEYVVTDVFTADSATATLLDGAELRFFASEDATRSTKYELDAAAKLYVNGVEISNPDKADFDKYVINNPVGTIEFVDTYTAGTPTDGEYDCIYVEYYVTGKVDAVSSTKITFADKTGIDKSNLVLDKEDNEDLQYNVFFNGEEIALTDIQKGDILSIKADPTVAVSASNFFEIYVSRDVQSGAVSDIDTYDEVITIGDVDYDFVYGSGDTFSTKVATFNLGSEYTVYLDIFGRIYKSEIVASSAKLAIIDRFYASSSSDSGYLATLYFADGTSKAYDLDFNKIDLGITMTGKGEKEVLSNLVYYGANASNDHKTPIENRVVEYKVSSTTNKITYLKFLKPYNTETLPAKTAYTEATANEYKSGKIGGVRMNSATTIIDATVYYEEWIENHTTDPWKNSPSVSDLAVGSLDTFVAGIDYVVWGFGDKDASGAYPFVLLTKGEGAYTEDTRFAVVQRALKVTTEKTTGEEGYGLVALYDGKDGREAENEMFVAYDATVNGTTITDSNYGTILKAGDVVVFQTNAKGDIDEIDIIFSNATIGANYATTVTNGLKANFGSLVAVPASATYWTKAWDPTNNDLSTSIVYGVVTGKTDAYFQLGQVATGTINYNDGTTDTSYTGLYTNLDADVVAGDTVVTSTNGGVMEIAITADTKVYVFDYDETSRDNMIKLGVPSDIEPTRIPDSQKIESTDAGKLGNVIIPWGATVDAETVATSNDIYFAFAKVVDGDATDVFVIRADSNN